MKILRAGPENIIKTVQQIPAQLSRAQRNAINQIYADYQDRRAALVLEHARLAARYGPRSYQAQLAQARIERYDTANVGLSAEVERVNMPTPAPKQKGFIVYGRVLDRKGNGVPMLEVAAIDANDNPITRTKTANKGAFSLTVPLTVSSPKNEPGADQTVQFSLRVSDQQGQALLRDTEVLEAAPSRIAYRELAVNVPSGGA